MARLGWWLLTFGMIAAVACSSGGGDNAPVPCANGEDCSTGVCDPTNKSCVECLRDSDCTDKAACRDRACVALTLCENTFDCPEGQVCGREAGYCAECFRDADCPDGGCVNEVCRPHCVSDKDCAEFSQLCDFDRNLCVDCVVDVDCPKSAFCGNGVCRPDICEAGAIECSADKSSVSRCTSNGAFEELEPCGAFGICTTKNGVDQCAQLICEPGSLHCDAEGARVGVCSEDGLAVQLLEDCQADEACVEGECTEVVCSPGERRCDGRSIYECNATGTSVDFFGTCVPGAYCDPELAECVAGKCTPGQKACSSGGVITCNADGSAYENIVACGGDKICKQGVCVQQACEAGIPFCQDGHPFSCDATGIVAEQADTCTSLEYCDVGTGSCKARVCTIGSKTCVGNTARICDALGSSYTEENCGSNGVCLAGECEPKICQPNKYFCDDEGNPRQCNVNGTASTQMDTCTASEECKVSGSGSSAICSPEGGSAGSEG